MFQFPMIARSALFAAILAGLASVSATPIAIPSSSAPNAAVSGRASLRRRGLSRAGRSVHRPAFQAESRIGDPRRRPSLRRSGERSDAQRNRRAHPLGLRMEGPLRPNRAEDPRCAERGRSRMARGDLRRVPARRRSNSLLPEGTRHLYSDLGHLRAAGARLRAARRPDAAGGRARARRAQELPGRAREYQARHDAENRRADSLAGDGGDARILRAGTPRGFRVGTGWAGQSGLRRCEPQDDRGDPRLSEIPRGRGRAQSSRQLRDRRRRLSPDAGRRRHGGSAALPARGDR